MPPDDASLFSITAAEWTALGLSLKVALWCMVLNLPPALLLGWLLARRHFPGKILLDGLIHLPLVMPPVATGYLLLLLLGRRGWIGAWLGQSWGIHLAFDFAGAVLAAMVVSFPLIVRAVRVALEMVDPKLEAAARTLGAGPLQAFWRVTLPLAAPGIVGGLILCFARSLGEFGATMIFAGNLEGETRTLPLAVYSALQRIDGETAALRLVLIAAAISLVAMAASEYLARRARARITGRDDA